MQKCLVTILVFLLVFPALAQEQWTSDGLLVGPTTANPANQSVISDGNGGFFVVYEHNPAGDADIYAQWVDGSGSLRWGSSGVAINTDVGDQKNPVVAMDAEGGAFIAWHDDGTGKVKIQRINSNKTLLWTSAKTASTASGVQSFVKMVSDGAGGVIVVWKDERNKTTNGTDLYAQRIDASGTRLWLDTGVPVSEATGDQSNHVVLQDGAGGAYVLWMDYRSYSSKGIDIYGQRLSQQTGGRLWQSGGSYDGIPVCNQTGNQQNITAKISGSNLIAAWEDYRNGSGNSDVYAQALNSSGTALWTTGGVAATNKTGNQVTCRLTTDGSGGAIIAWADYTLLDVWAQRINVSGACQWSSEGMAVITYSGYQISPEIASDDSGGAFIFWTDYRSGTSYDLYAQHVRSDQTLRWDASGKAVSTASGNQMSQSVLLDGSGGALVVWTDGRSSRNDLYAQHLNENVTVTGPTASSLLNGSQAQTIRWKMRTTNTFYSYFVISASTTTGDGFPIQISASTSPTALSASWTPSTVNSATVQIQITAYNDEDVVVGIYTGPTFTVDSSPPNAFSLSSPADGATVEPAPTFVWQATTDNLSGLDHYELWIDGVLKKTGLSTTTYTLTTSEKLADGSHTWTVKAVDKAGLVREATSRTLTAREDQDPPTAFHLLTPANNTWTTDTTPALTWGASSDAGTGLKKYKLYVDGSLYQDNISPTVTTVSTSTLANGSHTWYVVAVDSVDNTTQSTETWTVKIDDTPPIAFALSTPTSGSWTNDQTPTLAWQASSDAGVGLDHYVLYVDGVVVLSSVSKTAVSVDAPSTLAEGTHNWTLKAVDGLGNERAASSTFTIRVDVTAPNTFTLSTPQSGSYATTSSPTLSWQSTTDSGSGVDHYELWIDGAINRDNLSSTSTTPASALSEGSHTWLVKAVDAAGNSRTTSSWTVIVDTQPPLTFSLLSPAQGATVHTNKPTLSWQTISDATSGFAEFEVYVDGQLVANNLTSGQTSYTLTTALENGSHTWQAKAWDNAGNVRTPTAISFTVSVSAPVFTSSASASATEDVAFTYTATATDADGDALTYSFENYSSWLTPSGSKISGTPTEGVTSGAFTAKVTDGIFTTTLDVTVTVTPVNDPPELTSASLTTATEHQLFTYTATATDPENDALTYTFSNYPGWMTPSSDHISGTPPEGAQDTSFTVAVSDGKLTDMLGVTIRIQLVNDPPSITSSTTATATEHQFFSYTATATDPEDNPISFSYSDYPVWLTPSGSKISGTPPEGATNTTFKVTASDGSLTDTETIQLTVILVNDAPQITSATSANAVEHQAFSYTATAWDPEGNTLTFTFSDYPSWMTPSGSKISGTPPEGADNTSFKVTVSDGSLTDQETVTVTLQKVNDAPVITSATTVTATEHESFSYTATATDPENDPVTFTFSNYPSWMTASQNKISGTPPESAANTSFKLTASDGSLTDVETVQVNITSVNDAPAITSSLSASATEDVPFSYTATATDPEDDALTFSFSDYPAWMTPNGATISGTPIEGDQSTAFKVTVSDGSLSDTRTVAVTVTQVNDAPQITSIGQVTATEDVSFSYTTTATDPENDLLTYAYSAYPHWLTPEGNKISGTPMEGDGDTSFVVVVSDGLLTAQKTVQILVTAVNDPPVITSSKADSATEDILFSYVATGTDIEGSPVTLTFAHYPHWLTASGNRLSGTPTEGKQDTSFQVIASDGVLGDTITVQLTVIAVNDAPVITSPDSVTAAEDYAFTYRATATDIDGPQVTIAFIYTQKWLSAAGSELVGTPPNGVEKATFRVIATDNHPTNPQTDTLVVTIHILPINDPPYFEYDFPKPEWMDADTLQWVLPLDEYVKDPDNADSELSWQYRLLTDQNVTVAIAPVSHQATISLYHAKGIVQIEFTVSDPAGASAKDTLAISLVTSGVAAERIADAPKEYILYENYPNPFNPETTIRYGLPKPSSVNIRIYNLLGQEVLTLIKEKQQPGTYEIHWNAIGYASGIYFYRIEAEDWHKVKRMLLVK